MNRIISAFVAASVVGAMSTPATAQTWPTKPVRIVVSFPPGTPGDVITRLIQPALQKEWNQPVVVDNKPGAGGNVAAGEVAAAKGDHTLLVGPDTVLTINPHLYKKLSFSLRDTLKPITYYASFNQTLVCNPLVKVQSLRDFGKLSASTNYASGGAGSPSHMAMEMLLSASGTRLNHIPYRGPGPAAQDVIAGQVECGFIVSSIILPHVQSKNLKPIAMSSLSRSIALPAVPTVAESGYPGFDATFFEALMAPASLPEPIVTKIQRDVRAALADEATRSRLAEMDLRVVANTPSEAARRSAEDFAKWGAVAKRAGIQLD